MSDAARGGQSADDFIAWAMARPEGERWELAHGEAVAMAPERAAHGRAKLRIAERLAAAVRVADLPREVFIDGMAVQVDATTVYAPDVMMRRGTPLADDAVKLTDPVIVVEVVSPSSRTRDAGARLADYCRIDTLRHYLIVRTEDRTVMHHARGPDGQILTRILRGGPIDFGAGLVPDGIFPA
ncbi:MAG: Uma2 family endonuclease [Rhodospirillales bacterium]